MATLSVTMSTTNEPNPTGDQTSFIDLMPFVDHPASVNLRRLLGVRVLLLAGFVALVVLVHFGVGQALPLGAIGVIVAALAAVTLITWARLRWLPWPVRDIEIAAQLGFDVAALTAVLFFTGGWTNPLVSFYLVPIAVSVITLRALYTWVIFAATLVLYTALTVLHRPFLHFHGDVTMGNILQGFSLHVVGMWLTFVLCAVLIAYFGTSITATLRQRARALAALREENLRNEQIIGVAMLSAGTAHELGTPLSSIGIIAGELKRDAAARGDENSVEELQTLLGQVDACKAILGRLRAMAARPQRQSQRRQPLDTFLEGIRERWLLLRPSLRASFVIRTDASDTKPPVIAADTTLVQAIINLLNNAADVSPDDVTCEAHWDDSMLLLDIRDRGPGFSPELLARVGEPAGAARDRAGMGMGLLLANATVERLGGSVRIANRKAGGAWVQVRLPLSGLIDVTGANDPANEGRHRHVP